MAEHVQASLDQMVAPLRDLMDRNIFSDKEIRSIVSRRRESEYLLRRRAARKADFIRYIDAEMILEKLRSLRTAKKKRDHRKSQREKGIIDEDNHIDGENGENDNDNDKDKQKDHIGDIHIVQHIHLLFVRVIRKFRGDISLHLRHATFCKDVKSYTRLGRVYAEALQIFPRESGLWIEAASNEFFGQNRSVKGARVLLQRSLRINERNQELWLQYFTLELHYAQTLKGRQRILHPEKEEEEVEQDDDDDDDNNDDVDDGNNHDYYKIPLVIVRNAILAIPNSVHFRLKFLDVCQKFPDTSNLMDYVQDSMSRDFATEPESWIARAVYEAGKKKQKRKKQDTDNDNEEQEQKLLPKTKKARTSSSSSNEDANENENEDEDDNNKDPVVTVLQEAIDAIPTSEMLIQAFRFAEDYQNELLSDADNNNNNDVSTTPYAASAAAVKEEVDEFIRNVWTKAEGMDSSDLAMEQTHYLLNNNNVEEAVKIIKAYCTKSRGGGGGGGGATTAPCDAWILWTSLVTPLRKQKAILERAVQTISMDTHPDYVTVLLQLFGAQMQIIDEKDDDDDDDDDDELLHEKSLFNTLQKIILLAPKTVDDVRVQETGLEFELTDVFTAYLECLNFFFVRSRKGIQGARSVYESVLFRSTVTLSADNVEKVKTFIDRCLKLEQQELDTNTTGKKKRQHLCKLYDKAVEIFRGTSFEESYKEDRNEKGIFGGTVSS